MEYFRAKEDLGLFVECAWEVLEPETRLLWNWHHDLITEYLTACSTGQIRRLIVNVAPRSTKSTITTVSFAPWLWTKTPAKRFLFGSYASDLAVNHSVLRRNLIMSPWYQAGYGSAFQLAGDLNMKTEFANDKTGFMKTQGIKSPPTGEGGDYIIIDDPHNPKQAESEPQREDTLMNFDLGWSNRLNDKKTGVIIVIMQRLHERDLTGHLLAKNAGYEHVVLPTVAEKKTIILFPVSGKVFEREVGDLLHPEREGPEEIEKAKVDMTAYGFAGQHQQSPVPREGAIIKTAWLQKFYKELPAKIDQAVQSWDLTFKGTARSDFVTGIIIGRSGGQYFLYPTRIHGRLNFPETINAFRSYSAAYPTVLKKLVEAKANGAALIDTLGKEISGIVPYEPHGAKEERLAAVSPIFEAGNFILPDPSIAPWIQEYIDELCTFPRAPNDDYVDATTQALSILSQRRVLDWAPVSITGQSKWVGR